MREIEGERERGKKEPKKDRKVFSWMAGWHLGLRLDVFPLIVGKLWTFVLLRSFASLSLSIFLSLSLALSWPGPGRAPSTCTQLRNVAPKEAFRMVLDRDRDVCACVYVSYLYISVRVCVCV